MQLVFCRSSQYGLECVFKMTIDAVYSIDKIATSLEYINHHRHIRQKFLVFYDKMKFNRDIENPIIFKVAKFMKDIKEDPSVHK